MILGGELSRFAMPNLLTNRAIGRLMESMGEFVISLLVNRLDT